MLKKHSISLPKKISQTIRSYLEYLEAHPTNEQAWNNLGATYYHEKEIKKSIKCYKKALALKPDYLEALFNLAVAYLVDNQNKKAISSFHKILQQNSAHIPSLTGIAQIYQKTNNHKQAIKYYNALIKVNPTNLENYQHLVAIYKKNSLFNHAKKTIKKAIKLYPTTPHLYYNLGILEEQSRNLNKAILAYSQAINVDPHFYQAYPQLYMAKRKACDWKKLEAVENNIRKYHADTPFTSLVRTENLQENISSAKIASTIYPLTKPPASFVFKQNKSSKKIVLGYFSKDYCDHPIGQLIAPLFKQHDRKKFIVKCFSYTNPDRSSYYNQIRSGCDDYFDVRKMNNLELAQCVHRQKVDILIDNTGNTAENRYHVLAARPAPIQITWMGLLGSSGADFIDYQIVDPIVVPPSHFQFYTEKIIHLPLCLINNPSLTINKKIPSRKSMGIPENAFVFASFNQAYKINAEIWKVWLSIIKAIPESVLMLWEREKDASENLKQSAKSYGINPNRLIFAHKLSTSQHLARLRQVDLALDTPIYGGGTTSSQTLWAGVPIITILGEHYASRLTASLLTKANAPELITHSLDEYQSLAIKLALDHQKLIRIKSKLTQDILQTNLYNLSRFTANLEDAYTQAYSRYQQGLPPEHITIA